MQLSDKEQSYIDFFLRFPISSNITEEERNNLDAFAAHLRITNSRELENFCLGKKQCLK